MDNGNIVLRVCRICASPLPKGRTVYCSDRCMQEAARRRQASRAGKKERKYVSGVPVLHTAVCADCGKICERPIRAKYCEACQQKRKIERNRENCRRWYSGQTRHIGQMYPCAQCGEPFVLQSTAQKYCSTACADAAKSAKGNPAAREWNRRRQIDDPDYQKRIYKTRPRDPETRNCIVCGKPFELSLHFRLFCSEECRKKKIAENQKAYHERKK